MVSNMNVEERGTLQSNFSKCSPQVFLPKTEQWLIKLRGVQVDTEKVELYLYQIVRQCNSSPGSTTYRPSVSPQVPEPVSFPSMNKYNTSFSVIVMV